MSKRQLQGRDVLLNPTQVLWVGSPVSWARAALVASLLILAAAPLVVPDTYSVIDNTLSESGGQGVEGSWLFRFGVILAAAAVVVMTSAGSRWTPTAKRWFRLYGLGLILAVTFSEAPWDGRPHDQTEAFLHTVFIFMAGISFTLGVISLSGTRPTQARSAIFFDRAMVCAMVVIPLLMMVAADQEGLLQRFLVLMGYLWLLGESLRIDRGPG